MNTAHPVYLCGAQRTAVGKLGGGLASVCAVRLGAHVINAVLKKAALDKEFVEEVILGVVLTAGTGQAPARQAALLAGLPTKVQAMAINKVCSSGLKAVMLAANSVQLGMADAIIAGGMESMSQAPYLLPALRSGARLGNSEVLDSILKDGLWDPYEDFHMGNAAELCARKFSLSREEQDAYAIQSYSRAQQAIKEGFFTQEIVPISVKVGKKEVEFAVDEEPTSLQLDKVSQLKPAFQADGTVTAANASSINDGAAALLVCSEEFAKEHRLQPLARLVAQGWNAHEPKWFTTAPVGAVNNALKKAGKTLAEVDLFEINEAFSAVALACRQELQIDPAKLNICGGAVALGHPIGASGARILTTLLYSLQRLKLHCGVAAICNGGGEATTVVVERV